MRIDVSAIEDTKGASVEVDVLETVGRMNVAGREIAPAGPVEVRARATNTGRGRVLVQGQAKADLEVACDRCLKPCVIHTTFSFEQEYRKSHEERRLGQESAEGDRVDDRVYSGDHVDITPEVKESLALSLPIKVVCSEDCRGLCPNCGKNLNEGPCGCPGEIGDIRFAALSNLLRPGDSKSKS